MKLNDIIERMVQGEFSDALLDEFIKANRRSRSNFNRCQNCYTTAVQMPKENYLDAIALIRLGLEEYADEPLSKMESYYELGYVCEKSQDHLSARIAFMQAMEIARSDLPDYIPFIAGLLLRAEKNCNEYQYTPELEEYYNLANQSSSSDLFTDAQFDLLLSKALIEHHRGNREKAREAITQAENMLSSDYVGPWKEILARHHYEDSPKATAAALNFLQSMREKRTDG